jgi:hypothetical protein
MSDYSIGDKTYDTPEEFLVGYVKMQADMIKLCDIKNGKSGRSDYWDTFLSRAKVFSGRKPFPITSLRMKPEIKQCYYNSQMFAMGDDSVHYYEGFCYDEGLVPLEHAWNVVNGEVVDLTLDVVDRKFKEKRKPASTVYYGIEIPGKLVAQNTLKSGMAEAMYWKVFEQLATIQVKK